MRSWFNRQFRRWFGRYAIDDPQSIAEGAPYTFFLPSENELLAVEVGDIVKLCFHSLPGGRKWEAERMWVTVREMNGLTLRGILDNEPYDIPQLRLGDLVEFRRDQIYDIIWNADKEVAPPPSPERRDYWERCYADEQIVKNGLKVEFLYRVVPDAETADDDYPDSGWRFRCDTRSLTDEEYENSEFSYIAIGKVLNADDSWLHLIDEPVGSCFLRNWDTGAFEIGDRDVEGDQ